MLRILYFSVLLLTFNLAYAAPKVAVTIKPLHSLVSNLMQGLGEPVLLLQGGESPHTYQLRPSQVRLLHRSDMVIWVGENIESFLVKKIAALDKEKVFEVSALSDLTTYPIRESKHWEPHQHHEHETHDTVEMSHDEHKRTHTEEHNASHAHQHDDNHIDAHIWLDPHNAIVIATALAAKLSVIDPEHAAQYQTNAQKLKDKLNALDKQLSMQLASVSKPAYLVFHDAYQYFEQHYGLNAVGSITFSPEQQPSAQHISLLRQKINLLNVRCIFSEPQFEPKLIHTLLEGTTVKRGTLDPIGVALPADKNLYFKLMHNLSHNLHTCLATD